MSEFDYAAYRAAKKEAKERAKNLKAISSPYDIKMARMLREAVKVANSLDEEEIEDFFDMVQNGLLSTFPVDIQVVIITRLLEVPKFEAIVKKKHPELIELKSKLFGSSKDNKETTVSNEAGESGGRDWK